MPQPDPSLHFDCLSSADGLSFSLGRAILQDQRGFMWFGTRYGLNKYDGFNFTVSLLELSGDMLAGNYITVLSQDHLGDLWIATLSGLVRQEHETRALIHYKPDAADSHSLLPGRINAIGEDASGNLWVGTNGGLSRFDRSTGTFSRYLEGQSVLAIDLPPQGGAWLGTASGLWFYPQGFSDLVNPLKYQKDPADPSSLSDDIVNAVFVDHLGMVWSGTQYGGLSLLDSQTGRFTRYLHDPADPYSLTNNRVWTILEDDQGRVWVGSEAGLSLFDRAAGRFYTFHHDPADPYSLNGDEINDIYQDRSGVLWFATQSGFCKLNENASLFVHYGRGPSQVSVVQPAGTGNPLKMVSLSDDMVLSLYQDSQGILWVGTSSGGLNRLDRQAGDVTVYRHDPTDPASLPRGEVVALLKDRAGNFWVGTTAGFSRFDTQEGTFAAVESFQGMTVTSLAEDSQGNLWVGAWGGLFRRLSGSQEFTALPLGDETLGFVRVQELFLDRFGLLWVSTQNAGLFRVDPSQADGSGDAVVHFPQAAGDPQGPGLSPVMSFYEDAHGILWMGSVNDGLLRYDRASHSFAHYLPEMGIAQYIGCIQEDAQGFLWMNTAYGLARFDSPGEKFTFYDSRDGLIVDQGAACAISPEGDLFFGSLVGLNVFNPGQLRDNSHPPSVVVTSLNLRGQVLRTDLQDNEQVRLPYRENYLSFDFAALDYTAPAKNRYAYQMEGLDDGWIEAGARRHADYPDLKPGTYTFRVVASNNSGVWNEQGAAVLITITPPFWQTGWFLGLVGLTFAGIVAGGVRLRLKGLERRSRHLESQVRERTGALEQKTLELEQHAQEIEQRRQELEALLQENARLNQQAQELAVLEERSRLARELHDAVTQTLFSASLVAEALPTTWEKDPQEGRGLLQELRSLSRGALAEMRTLLLELRPAALLETSLGDLLRQLGEAASGREGIPVDVRVDGQGDLPPDVHIALYRITQEVLNNVVKHARAHQVVVQLSYGKGKPVDQAALNEGEPSQEPGLSLWLSIRDDGRGFDPARVPHNRLGLGIMQERAQAIGASLTIESQPGQGTRVSVQWKLGRSKPIEDMGNKIG
jgi:signal transduction histidine kinase/ligand-binding sensor domain-containing protein